MTKKDEIIKSLEIHSKDVGSAEVQIGLLSKKIEKLSDHFRSLKRQAFKNGFEQVCK